MLLQTFLQAVLCLRRQGLRLGQIHDAVDIGGIRHHPFHAHVIRRAGAQHHALGHRPGAQRLPAQGPVDDGLIRSQIKEHPGYLPQLAGDGWPCQLDVSGAAGPKDHHLTQRRGNAGGLQDLRGHIAQPQHVPGRGDQGSLPDENAGLFCTRHHVGGLAVPPDGRQAQGSLKPVVMQHPVKHSGLSCVFAHAHNGHGFHAVQYLQQL